jgi:hypothetical protein
MKKKVTKVATALEQAIMTCIGDVERTAGYIIDGFEIYAPTYILNVLDKLVKRGEVIENIDVVTKRRRFVVVSKEGK